MGATEDPMWHTDLNRWVHPGEPEYARDAAPTPEGVALGVEEREAWRRCKRAGCSLWAWGLGTASPEEPRNCAYHEGFDEGLAAGRAAHEGLLREVGRLHEPNWEYRCGTCAEPWPCPTTEALAAGVRGE